MVWDVERGVLDNAQSDPWQTCSCIGNWHYDRGLYERNGYKTAKTVIQMLIDIVSKNGNLLLNIPVRGDGTIDEKEVAIVEGIAAWMDINSESILGTRPWKVFGEGPSVDASNPINGPGFNEGKVKLSAKDIRFNQKGNTLYVTTLGVPAEDVLIKSLGKNANDGEIKKIEILGSNEKVTWQQNADAMIIKKPQTIPNNIAVVYQVHR